MNHQPQIPVWSLYGETHAFPDVLHLEHIADRAAGHDWHIQPHRHVHLHQIFLLTSGQIAISLDARKLRLTPPVALNIPRGHVHGFAFSAGTQGYVLTLPASDFPDLFGPAAPTSAPLSSPFTLPATGPIAAQFEQLAAAFTAQSPFRTTALRAQTMALILTLLQALPQQEAAKARQNPHFARFEAMLRANPRAPVDIAKQASALGLSTRHLSRLCRAETGLSAIGFAQSHKAREAARLLVYTRMPVQEVAFALGFDDPAYFSRSFQRALGVSPRAYRARFDAAATAPASVPVGIQSAPKSSTSSGRRPSSPAK